MMHFLANEWDKSQAQRRGGGLRLLSLDEAAAEQRYQLEPIDYTTPETLFERRWPQTVMSIVLERLAAEMDEKRFEVLKRFLLEDKGTVSYEAVSEQLGMSVAAITSAIHRMRGRFRALLFEEVASTEPLARNRPTAPCCVPCSLTVVVDRNSQNAFAEHFANIDCVER